MYWLCSLKFITQEMDAEACVASILDDDYGATLVTLKCEPVSTPSERSAATLEHDSGSLQTLYGSHKVEALQTRKFMRAHVHRRHIPNGPQSERSQAQSATHLHKSSYRGLCCSMRHLFATDATGCFRMQHLWRP